MNYVCGFLLSFNLQEVLLVKKTHPEWQKGKWNGIGGKIEVIDQLTSDPDNPKVGYYLTETPFKAMIREFHEETGITTTRERWHCFHIEEFNKGPDHTINIKVYYLAAFGDETKHQYLGPKNDPLFKIIQGHSILDILKNPDMYIYNLPYLLDMIRTNFIRGYFKNLNPQGVNHIS